MSLLIVTSGCSTAASSGGSSVDQTTKAGASAANVSDKNLVSANVVKVIDGDTISVQYQGKEETVRFLLVDTPETHHPTLGVQPFGPEASQYMHQLLDGGKVQLELAEDNGRDKYGRLLAYIFHNGKSVEEELLKRGLARVAYVYPPNTKYVEEYRSVQKQAQNKKIGIWSVDNYAREDGYHPEVINNNEDSTSSSDQNNIRQPAEDNPHGYAPDSNGNCSGGIKGNISSGNSKIYHLPSDRYYKVTKAEACYKTVKDAVLDGFRASK